MTLPSFPSVDAPPRDRAPVGLAGIGETLDVEITPADDDAHHRASLTAAIASVHLLAPASIDVVYRMPTSERMIALTIDDAPSDSTPRILEVLARQGATATFFIIGSHAERHPQSLEHIHSAGHELGNHLYVDSRSSRLAPDVFAEHLTRTDAIIRRVAPPRWMRPGAGRFAEFMREPMDSLGYRGVLGTIYPFDPHIPLRWFMVDVVLGAAHPGGIIILHDGHARGRRTADALEQILPRLRDDGYRVVSLTELDRSSRGASASRKPR